MKRLESSILTRQILKVNVVMGSRPAVIMMDSFLDHEAEPLTIKLHKRVAI